MMEENCNKIKELVVDLCVNSTYCDGKGQQFATIVMKKLRQLHDTKEVAQTWDMVSIRMLVRFRKAPSIR